MNIVINSPACDYLTLTTPDTGVAHKLEITFRLLQGRSPAKIGKRMQYEGRIIEGLFLGRAIQGGDTGYMLQSSGYQAHRVMQTLQADKQADRPRASRLDLQITVERVRDDTGLSLYKEAILASIASTTKGRMPALSMFDKLGQWGETIYIGSRASERYIRIYDKVYDDRQGIRFEAEYKGSIADSVFKGMLARDSYAGDVMTSELAKLAGIPLFDRMREIVNGDDGFRPTVTTVPTSDDSRLEWIENTVWPAIRKMYLSGAHKGRLMVLIAELAQMTDDYPLDNLW